MNISLSRRQILKLGAAGAAAAGLPMLAGCAGNAAQAEPVVLMPTRKRVLRFAHLTDMHVQPEKQAGEGFARCLEHVQAQPQIPELIITGGDHVMDSFDADDARTAVQWDVFTKTWRDHCAIPAAHCLGNHDCWGWDNAKSKTTGGEANWGKRRSMDALGMPGPHPYQAFTKNGWRFIILDSTFPEPGGYIARLDDVQFQWLAAELASTPLSMPVVVVSHMPIVSGTYIISDKEEVKKDRKVSASLIHIDGRRLVNLFRKHPNVKLCVSGHVHLRDRVDLHGITFVCAGARRMQ